MRQKRYIDARRILVHMDHPTASIYLERLDEILDSNDRVKPERQNVSRWALVFVLLLVTSVLLVMLNPIDDGIREEFELIITGIIQTNEAKATLGISYDGSDNERKSGDLVSATPTTENNLILTVFIQTNEAKTTLEAFYDSNDRERKLDDLISLTPIGQ